MPLTGDPSVDIPELIASGHPQKQAVAIALHEAGDVAPPTVRQYDLNGWYEVQDNPISRVGVFPYRASMIQAPGWEQNPNEIWMVYRPEEELADPECVKSFRLVPWTNDHAMLGDPDQGTGLVPAEQKGVHGVIGEQTYYDPETRTLYGNIKLFSTSMADLIDVGKKELSLGFRCVYDFVSGEFEGKPYRAIQRTIRGNHIATVQHGRMGPGVAVLDHAVFTFDAKDLIAMKKKVTRREIFARTLKSHAAFAGVDLSNQTALKAAFDRALDEEVDDEAPAAGGEPSLSEVSETLKAIAPALAEIKKTIASLSSAGESDGDELSPDAPDGETDEMEPMLDEAGNVVMDAATGLPKMQKKKVAPPAVPAADTTVKAMDQAIAAMDAAIIANPTQAVALRTQAAGLRATRQRIVAAAASASNRGALSALVKRLKTAEDSLDKLSKTDTTKTLLGEIASRDALAGKVVPFVGTFDHSNMTAGEVAKYACEKLGLKATAGHEAATLEGYLHGRTPPNRERAFALDGGAAGATAGAGKVDDYFKGTKAA